MLLGGLGHTSSAHETDTQAEPTATPQMLTAGHQTSHMATLRAFRERKDVLAGGLLLLHLVWFTWSVMPLTFIQVTLVCQFFCCIYLFGLVQLTDL